MQGWYIDLAGPNIVFNEAPPVGTGNVVVVQHPTGGTGGTDVWAMGAWSDAYGYPVEVEFFGDRLWFGGWPGDPQAFAASCIGDYNNFGRSSPIVDSDAITARVNARQVNAIYDLLPMDSLIAMTLGGEFRLTGSADDPVTPSTVLARGQSNYGSGQVPAKIIGDSAIFLQNEGQVVRDLSYQFEKDGFVGADISVWAQHLFHGHVFTGIEFWKAPWSVVWFTRDDGLLVGCTYLPEQEVIGWHWHDTDGEVVDVCALPGVAESECYYLTRRVIDGEVVQYIEQGAPTRYDDEVDYVFTDAAATYDGRNAEVTTLTVTSTTGGFTEADDLVVTATNPIFTGASDIGDALFLYWTDYQEQFVEGEPVLVPVARVQRLIIDTFTSSTVVGVHPVGDVPAGLQATPWTDWGFARDEIAGLWHLEGKSVRVLQDAAVAGPYTVADGRIQLGEPGCVVHVGLGYTAEVETLELNAPGSEPLRDANKLVWKAALTVLGTRGVLLQDIAANLPPFPMKDRSFEPYGTPPLSRTGVFEAIVPSQWGVDAGRIRVLSRDPLPMELLALTISATASGKP